MVSSPVKAIKANYWLIMRRPPLRLVPTPSPAQAGLWWALHVTSGLCSWWPDQRWWYAGVIPQYHNYAQTDPPPGHGVIPRYPISRVGQAYINNTTSYHSSYARPASTVESWWVSHTVWEICWNTLRPCSHTASHTHFIDYLFCGILNSNGQSLPSSLHF